MKSIALALVLVAAGAAGTAHAQDIIPPKTYTMTPGGVSLADGSFTFTDTDLTIGTLNLQRFHLGGIRDPNDPYFGARMSHNFDIYVAPNVGTRCPGGPTTCLTMKKPIVHMGLSASGTYSENMPPNVSINYQNEDALAGTLVYNTDGAYVYTDSDGTVYTFSTTVTVLGASSNTRRVANIVFANGRRQDFLYNGSGQLKAVTDSSGYAIVFDYASTDRVSVACGYNLAETYVTMASTCTGAALKVSYGYSTDGKLTSVTDVLGKVTRYEYNRNEIACVKPPTYSTCKVTNVYGHSQYAWVVTQQTLADNAVWNFSFWGDRLKARDPETYVEVEPSTGVTVTDPAGKTSSYSFVQTSPYGAMDANGNSTSYRFRGGWDFDLPVGYSENYGSKLVKVTLPEGNQYLATYGIRRAVTSETLRAKPGSGLADLVKLYGYVTNCETAPNTPQNCAKPIWIKDAKGNQTDFAYASWGGTLSEMQPAPSVGAARPLKLFTWVQKYAYIKNSGGTLVQAAAPIWMPDTETLCQTVAGSSVATCDPAAPITVTSYQYGADPSANNLLVRGKVVTADGVSLRSCYGYDGRGNKIFETSPRAGLMICQ